MKEGSNKITGKEQMEGAKSNVGRKDLGLGTNYFFVLMQNCLVVLMGICGGNMVWEKQELKNMVWSHLHC